MWGASNGSAVASVTGIGGCLGGFGGFLFTGQMAGYVTEHYGFTPIFLIMGAFHLTGLAILHWGMGDLEPLGGLKAAPPRVS